MKRNPSWSLPCIPYTQAIPPYPSHCPEKEKRIHLSRNTGPHWLPARVDINTDCCLATQQGSVILALSPSTPGPEPTKVSNLGVHAAVKQDVLRFQVAVDDHVSVAVIDCRDDLLEESPCLWVLYLQPGALKIHRMAPDSSYAFWAFYKSCPTYALGKHSTTLEDTSLKDVYIRLLILNGIFLIIMKKAHLIHFTHSS